MPMLAAAAPLITAVSTVAGVGLGIAGYQQQKNAAGQMQSAQQDMVRQEQAAEAQRQQAMELDARRRMLETVRQSNVARATSLAAATAGGAQFGSGLQGAYGNIAGNENTALAGTSQNLQIGRNIFGINSAISQDRINYSGAQGDMFSGAGLMSLGGKVVSLGPTIGNIGATFGGWMGGLGNFGGGGYGGNYGANMGYGYTNASGFRAGGV